MADLNEMREELSSMVVSTLKEAEEYEDSFEKYSYLWVDDLQESMRNFLIHGHAVSPEDLGVRVEESGPKTPPTLAQFQQQVRGNPARLQARPGEGHGGRCRARRVLFLPWPPGANRPENRPATPSSHRGRARPRRAAWGAPGSVRRRRGQDGVGGHLGRGLCGKERVRQGRRASAWPV